MKKARRQRDGVRNNPQMEFTVSRKGVCYGAKK